MTSLISGNWWWVAEFRKLLHVKLWSLIITVFALLSHQADRMNGFGVWGIVIHHGRQCLLVVWRFVKLIQVVDVCWLLLVTSASKSRPFTTLDFNHKFAFNRYLYFASRAATNTIKTVTRQAHTQRVTVMFFSLTQELLLFLVRCTVCKVCLTVRCHCWMLRVSRWGRCSRPAQQHLLPVDSTYRRCLERTIPTTCSRYVHSRAGRANNKCVVQPSLVPVRTHIMNYILIWGWVSVLKKIHSAITWQCVCNMRLGKMTQL